MYIRSFEQASLSRILELGGISTTSGVCGNNNASIICRSYRALISIPTTLNLNCTSANQRCDRLLFIG
jgi:hypothetical protein